MAVKERERSRVVTRDKQVVEYVRFFTALEADLSEGADGWTGTGLPARAALYPSGTWSPTISTPRMYRIEVDPRPPKHKGFCLVAARYKGPRIKRTTGSLYELYASELRRRVSKFAWRDSRKEYVSLDADRIKTETALWGMKFPGSSGPYAPTCTEVLTREDWIPGLAKSTAIFKTVPGLGYSIRKGKLYGGTIRMPYRPQKDQDGKIIGTRQGVLDADGVHWWKLVKGDPRASRSRLLLRLDAKLSNLNLAATEKMLDHVNTYRMPNLLGAAAGTVLFYDFRFGKGNDGLFNVSFYFNREPLGWNNLVKTQRHIQVASELVTSEWAADKDNRKLVESSRQSAQRLIPGHWINVKACQADATVAMDLVDVGPQSRRLWASADLNYLIRNIDFT